MKDRPRMPANVPRLDDFEKGVNRLWRYLERHNACDLCAVFDIGTKATKLLVGPATPPTTAAGWGKDGFFNDGQVFQLGADYDRFTRVLDIPRSKALVGVCYFIGFYKQLLMGQGMPAEAVHAVGTAVFHWMDNRADVVAHIRAETGVTLTILNPESEAFLSCYAVKNTYGFGRIDDTVIGNDVILLIDQGGGSTEVSFFLPQAVLLGRQESLKEFGTVALQNEFFSMRDKAGAGPPDPLQNRNRISTQFTRINEEIARRVTEWAGFPSLLREKKRIHAYGMGTALSKCLDSHSTIDRHNETLTVRRMDDALASECEELDNSRQQVKTLYAELEKEEASGGKRLRDRLVMLYGLPVYQQLLRKFGLDHLRFAGYGLRYGAYLALRKGMSIDGLHAHEQAPPPRSESGRSTTTRVFLSYAGTDVKLATRIHDGLRQAGLQVWFDDAAIRAGDVFVAHINKGIDDSDVMVVVLSEASMKSSWVEVEWQAMRTLQLTTNAKSIIPIRVDNCLAPPLLAALSAIDFRAGYDAGMPRLLTVLQPRDRTT